MTAEAVEVVFAGRDAGWLTVQLSPAGGYGQDLTQIFGTSDGGSTWQLQWSGPGAPAQLVATSPEHASVLLRTGTCSASTPIEACQERLLATALVVTTDGGGSWATVWTSPYQLSELNWSGPSVGLASLVTNTCLDQVPPDGSTLPNCPGEVVATTDGGRHWAPSLHLSGPVVGLARTGAGTWLVAQLGTQEMSGGKPLEQTYLRLWAAKDERHWTVRGQLAGTPASFSGPQTQVTLLAPAHGAWWMSYDGPDSCAMHGCGAVGTWYSQDGGRTWAEALIPPAANDGCGPDRFMPIAQAPTGSLYVSEGVNLAACSPPGGQLDRWDGRAWERVHIWAVGSASDLSWPAPATGFAILSGALARSLDGGYTWEQVWPAPSPTGQVSALDATHALAAGDLSDPGAVLYTSDGGQRWSEVADLPGMVTAVALPGASDAFAVDLDPATNTWRLMVSSNGGRHWEVRRGLPEQAGFGQRDYGPSAIWMARDGAGVAITTTGASVYNTYGEGPATIWATTDAGRTWERAGEVPIGDDPFGSAGFGYHAGHWDGVVEGNIGPSYSFKPVTLVTTDGGARWARSGHFPSLSGIDVLAPQLVLGWAARANGSVLYATSDGGAHWASEPLPGPGGELGLGLGAAASLSFTSADQGWWQLGGTVWTTADGGREWVRASPASAAV